MPEALINGTAVYFERRGTGPVLLMLHGIGSRSRSFRKQLEGLSDAYTAVAWDAPGYGRSGDPPVPITMESLADDAAGLVEHLGTERAHVLGHSMGGVVAQLLYHRHPQRVASLILSDTMPGSGSLPEPERAARLQARLAALDSSTPRQLAERRAPQIVAPGAPPDLVAEIAAVMAEIRPATYRAAALAIAATDLTPLLPKIAVPTLVICGEHDTTTTPAQCEAMARAIPNARFVLLRDAGHASNQEQPAAYNDAVRAFLAEAEAKAESSPRPG